MSSYTIDHKYGSRYASSGSSNIVILLTVLNKTIIPLVLVRYEIVIANEARMAIYHLISNARSWNNC